MASKSQHSHLPKIIQLLFLFTIGLFTITVFVFNTASATGAPINLRYSIDRSAVPILNYYDLTLIINVSDASSITITDQDSNPIRYKAGPAADEITVTTASDEITVTLDGVTDQQNLGDFRKADLKDNFAWAYSHGFDDNFALDGARQVFLDKNIPATVHVVFDWVRVINGWNDAQGRSNDFSPAEFIEVVNAGWDVNNHSVHHEEVLGQQKCFPDWDRADRKNDVLQAQTQIETLFANSSVPDYKIIGYTIPCGGAAQWAHYPDIIHEIRDNRENSLLYYEGGQGNPIVYMSVSPPFDFDREVLRDGRIDGSGGRAEFITTTFQTISTLTQQGDNPIWYTTLSHGAHLFGDNEIELDKMLTHLINTYGSEGTDEVWIAPSATVYSYLLVRDKSVVTQIEGPEITTTPTSIQTPITTTSPHPIPTPQSTGTPQPPTTDKVTFLPAIITN